MVCWNHVAQHVMKFIKMQCHLKLPIYSIFGANLHTKAKHALLVLHPLMLIILSFPEVLTLE